MALQPAPRWPVDVKLAKAFSDLEGDILGVDIGREILVAWTEGEIALYSIQDAKLRRKIAAHTVEVGSGGATSSSSSTSPVAATSSSSGATAGGPTTPGAPSNSPMIVPEHAFVSVQLKQHDPSYAFVLSATHPLLLTGTGGASSSSKDSATSSEDEPMTGGASGTGAASGTSGSATTSSSSSTTAPGATASGGASPSSSSSSSVSPFRRRPDRLRLMDLLEDVTLFQIATESVLYREHINFVSLHPTQDILLLGTTCNVSLWDYSAYNPKKKAADDASKGLVALGKTDTTGEVTSAAFDSQGMVFGLCTGQETIHLFDSKTFAKGSFLTFRLGKPCEKLEFSPCGKYVLCNYTSLLDAYDGDPIVEYRNSSSSEPLAAHFSPDSEFVMQVTRNAVHIFSTTNGVLERTIPLPAVPASTAGADQPLACGSWNPTRAMFATACGKLMHWWV
ncbi:unnamed protein product [Amoebophrya sp. A25]|nr:unnamed protein product [Amoebophrya sp. A25]|eukprot:GSA25T00021808001.1